MTNLKLPKRDPEAAHAREVTAARRVGPNAKCACGETRPEALIAGSKPIICAECQRKKEGKTTKDDHHVAGEANSPVTIPMPVNDHRAELNVAQYDWPKVDARKSGRLPPARGCRGAFVGFIDYRSLSHQDSSCFGLRRCSKQLDAFLVETVRAEMVDRHSAGAIRAEALV